MFEKMADTLKMINLNLSQETQNLEQIANNLNEFKGNSIILYPDNKRYKIGLEIISKGPCSFSIYKQQLNLMKKDNSYNLSEITASFKINPNSWKFIEIKDNKFIGRGISADLEGDNQGIVQIYSY